MRILIFKIWILLALGCMIARDAQYLTCNLSGKVEWCENDEDTQNETEQKSSDKKEKESEEQENNLWSFHYLLQFEATTALKFSKSFSAQTLFLTQPYLAVFSPPPDWV